MCKEQNKTDITKQANKAKEAEEDKGSMVAQEIQPHKVLILQKQDKVAGLVELQMVQFRSEWLGRHVKAGIEGKRWGYLAKL